MHHPAIPTSLIALSAPLAVAMAEPVSPAVAQIVIHERITIRVPRMPLAAPVSRPQPGKGWQERKGPKCLDTAAVAAAAIVAPSSVDLLLADGSWMRARLDNDCRSVDFYSGLYIRPGGDGRICADRDAIRVRSGARCEIDSFKVLVARR
ncbi:hypothetical protein [Sphingomonas mollis]|uniref:Uncharacterized protein n=1 Tax=Sphingomonas mollis TaxID=2795726 RepID=A0ABS0XQ77_9SPHN|nr:hypothetical protein [Sphingomonas sp. BT553]MBJ6122202.1 hypothetical protein [Sphingomonas sp. BT553]